MDKPRKNEHIRIRRLPDGGTSEVIDWEAFSNRLSIYVKYQESQIIELKSIIKRLNKK